MRVPLVAGGELSVETSYSYFAVDPKEVQVKETELVVIEVVARLVMAG